MREVAQPGGGVWIQNPTNCLYEYWLPNARGPIVSIDNRELMMNHKSARILRIEDESRRRVDRETSRQERAYPTLHGIKEVLAGLKKPNLSEDARGELLDTAVELEAKHGPAPVLRRRPRKWVVYRLVR